MKDNGTGITPEALKHIFKRYHRGDHQNDMKINGHGQGLYFARMVVRAHGGSITAESVVGTGTTFTVKIKQQDGKQDEDSLCRRL